jgi:hypothetical protein
VLVASFVGELTAEQLFARFGAGFDGHAMTPVTRDGAE